jgi:hypothetical protein
MRSRSVCWAIRSEGRHAKRVRVPNIGRAPAWRTHTTCDIPGRPEAAVGFGLRRDQRPRVYDQAARDVPTAVVAGLTAITAGFRSARPDTWITAASCRAAS